MAIKIGTGPDSWGVWAPSAPGQIRWDQFLDESVEAGYEWIEVGMYGYLPTDPTTLRAELDKRGIKVTATTVMKGHLEKESDWPKLEREVLRAGEFGAELGTKHLVLIDDTYVDRMTLKKVEPERLEEDAWKRLIDATHRVADICRQKFGIPVAFHPHADGHVETEAQTEQFLEDTDPSKCLYASTLAITPIGAETR